MPTKNEAALASHVVLRLDRDPDLCAAWMDSADRVCGKPAAVPWLCPRHQKVAEKRAGKAAAPAVRADESKADWYADQIAATEARIARREATIKRWEARPRVDASDALAAINAPLKQRQRGLAGELKAWRAYEYAISDLPAARARLAWLHEKKPA